MNRIFLRLVMATLVFGALLFAAAGTVMWPAAWAYLAIVTASLIAYSSILRLHPDLIQERSKPPSRRRRQVAARYSFTVSVHMSPTPRRSRSAAVAWCSACARCQLSKGVSVSTPVTYPSTRFARRDAKNDPWQQSWKMMKTRTSRAPASTDSARASQGCSSRHVAPARLSHLTSVSRRAHRTTRSACGSAGTLLHVAPPERSPL